MSIQKCGLNLNAAQKELQPHGTIEFPCAAYRSCHTDSLNDAIPWHWHEEAEIIYIKAGSLKLQIPGKEYTLREGELAVINSNILHYVIGAPFGELQSMVFSAMLLTGGNTTAFYKKYIHPLIACSNFDVWKNAEIYSG